MQNQVTELITPNKDSIRKHLAFLVDGLDDYADGFLHIAYGQKDINQARNFQIDDIDAAVEFIDKINGEKNNVYVAGSIMSPDIGANQRGSKALFYATNNIWCDIDQDIDPLELKARYKGLPPRIAVITGTVPYRRVHLWWKLIDPISEIPEIEMLVQGVQQSIGGDPATKNADRVMRVAGTVAWPVKKGRVKEMTSLHDIPGAADLLSAHRVAAVYPLKDFVNTQYSAAPAGEVTKTASMFGGEKISDGRDYYMSKMVYASILNLTRQLSRWPTAQEVFDDAWPVYERKVSTRNGVPLEQDGRGRKHMQNKINSKLPAFVAGRMRGWPSIDTVLATAKTTTKAEALGYDPETGEIIETPVQEILSPFRATSIDSIDLDKIRPREFLYGDMLGRKYVTMLVAPPGAGKSILTLQIAMSAAAGKSWGCWKPQGALNVWVYNNEEGEDELYRRLKAILIESKTDKAEVSGKLYVDSGERRAITVARAGETDDVVHTPDYDALKSEVLVRGIDVLIIDPFAETHSVNENSNDQIKQVTRLYRQIAMECNCAVMLVHHTRKGAGRDAESAGNADTARGGGAQIGVVRRAFTLGSMDSNTAEKYGIPDDKKRWFVRFDDAKSNITAPTEKTVWMKFKSIPIMNGNIMYPEGDYVGVLEHVEDIEQASKDFAGDMADRHEYVIEMMTVCMVNRGETQTTIKDICKYLKENSRLKYSERRLQDFIKDAIDYYKTKPAYVYNEETHVYRISSERGEKNALSVVRTSRELPV